MVQITYDQKLFVEDSKQQATSLRPTKCSEGVNQ